MYTTAACMSITLVLMLMSMVVRLWICFVLVFCARLIGGFVGCIVWNCKHSWLGWHFEGSLSGTSHYEDVDVDKSSVASALCLIKRPWPFREYFTRFFGELRRLPIDWHN